MAGIRLFMDNYHVFAFICLFYSFISFNMNNESQYEYKSYLDIIPNDIIRYMLKKEYLSPELNIMWSYMSSLTKAISIVKKLNNK